MRLNARQRQRAAAAREALDRRDLTPDAAGRYRSGYRTFGADVAEHLIATGEAERRPDGRVVRRDRGA